MSMPPLYQGDPDLKPRYTVKQVSEMIQLSAHTIRYYENLGLIPNVDRTDGNIRMFSEYAIGWLRLVHCLRMTGLPIEGVRHYIKLCMKGDSTAAERAEIILEQEKRLKEQIADLNRQMQYLQKKKEYYAELLASGAEDLCNPKSVLDRLREQQKD